MSLRLILFSVRQFEYSKTLVEISCLYLSCFEFTLLKISFTFSQLSFFVWLSAVRAIPTRKDFFVYLSCSKLFRAVTAPSILKTNRPHIPNLVQTLFLDMFDYQKNSHDKVCEHDLLFYFDWWHDDSVSYHHIANLNFCCEVVDTVVQHNHIT